MLPGPVIPAVGDYSSFSSRSSRFAGSGCEGVSVALLCSSPSSTGLPSAVTRGAAVGDKTMLDALVPAADALDESFAAAAEAAEEGALSTVPLQARKGRASYLGERSIGHADPGATSVGYLLAAIAPAPA